MKKIIIFLTLVFYVVSGYSQFNIKGHTVLNKFVLGFDNEKSLERKGVDIIEELTVHTFGENPLIRKVVINEHFFKNQVSSVVLLLVNDELYSVRIYPRSNYSDRRINAHMDLLNNKYKTIFQRQEWENDFVNVKYCPESEEESFLYLDKSLANKYPKPFQSF